MRSHQFKAILTLIFTFFIISSVFSQETSCADGIDNDGDGFVDCYDIDCAGGPSCTDFYFGNSVVCKDEPTKNPIFKLKVAWTSADETANSHSSPTVGDIDQDGTPEIVVSNRQARTVSILDGVTGATEFQINTAFEPENGLVLANLQGDDCAEIIVVENVGNDIAVYDCEGNLVWTAKSTRNNIGLPSVADFNQDGVAELYYKNEIRDALTGTILVTGSGNWDKDFVHGPIAVDIDETNPGLELITGNEIYGVDLAAGTLTLLHDMDVDLASSGYTGKYYPKYYAAWDDQWTAISVADVNLDGHMDVVTSGALGSDHNGRTSTFYWDVTNNFVAVYQDAGNNFNRGTGRINIADVDGDGNLNMNYVQNQKLYSLQLDTTAGQVELRTLWTKNIKEGTSGFTGCTLFDFDGDGASETVYRSESSLIIIDGKNGDTRQEYTCISRTQEEYPIVADVDGDGASEICVPCYTSDLTSFNPYNNTRFSHIRVFEADGEVWQPSREVWNQHGYFSVNVNDDLTIPVEQQNHTKVFSEGECPEFESIDGKNRVLNGFLNQAPYVEANGCPSYVSPDIEFVGIIETTPSSCPETTFEIRFVITNTGDTDLSGTLPVSFYDGYAIQDGTGLYDPSSSYLSTTLAVLNNFDVGDTDTITLTVDGKGGNYTLFTVINDLGQTPPIVLGASTIPECDVDDNYQATEVSYTPFSLTANKLKDNEKCIASKPDNGQAEAYFEGTLGGENEAFWSENFGDLNVNDNTDNGETAWTATNSGSPSFWGVTNTSGSLAYGVFNTGEQNENRPVTWQSELIDISNYDDVTFSMDMLSDGALEASGQWRDVMRVYYSLDGGSRVLVSEGYGDFGYQQASANIADGSTLQVIFTMHSTSDDELFWADNIVVRGIGAPVNKKFTDADGFQFNWYDATDTDYSDPVASGSLVSSLSSGTYNVLGYSPQSFCFSDTLSISIDSTGVNFNVKVDTVQSLTSCATPNGMLRAFVYTQTDASGDPLDTITTGYQFKWFISSEGVTPIGTGDTIRNLEAISYTVEVTHDLSGCQSSGSNAVTSKLSFPDFNGIAVDITNIEDCNGTGDLSASMNGGTTGFDFEWYIGNSLKPTVDFNTADITGLAEGDYTLRVIDQTTLCSSETITVAVQDVSTNPNPTITVNQHNTACGNNNYNGSATVDPGTASNVSITWYVGTTTANANSLPGAITGSSVSANDLTVNGLPEGIYTASVKKGGCTVNETVEILENSSGPSFSFITPVDAGSAINFSNKSWLDIPQAIAGWEEITISYWAFLSNENYLNDHLIFSSGGTNEDQVVLWTDNTDGLAFVVKTAGDGGRGRINTNFKPTGWTQLTGVWSLGDLNGDGINGDMALYADGVLLGTDNYTGNGNGLLNAGSDMYIARDGNLGVNKFEGRIDEFKIYNKALTPTEVADATCADADGTEEGLVIYYDFDGLTITNDGGSIPNRGTATNSTTNVNTGNSGADYDATINLQAQGTVSYLTSSIECPLGYATNNSTCDAANPNGVMDVRNGITPANGDYVYTLYSGYSTDTQIAQVTSPNDPIFTGLAAGFYTIQALDQNSGCATDPLSFSIANVEDRPTIVTTLTPDQGCATTGLGEIKVVSYSITEPGSYTYELFNGATFDAGSLLSTETVSDGSVGFTFTGLINGSYRIRVTNDDEFCTFYKDVIIDDVSSAPVVQSAAASVNASCGLPNGAMNIIMADGNENFTFSFYNGSVVKATADATVVGVANVAASYGGLAAGQYTVVARSNTTGCPSATVTRTIVDQLVYPDITTTQVQAQTSCAGGSPDGQASASVTDGNGANQIETEGYSFEWFNASNDLVSSTSTTSENLPSGDYTVTVTNDNTGCSASENITIDFTPSRPSISTTALALVNNVVCDETTISTTGQISVAVVFNGITITSPSANGYTFTWYEGSGIIGQNITTSGSTNGSTPTGQSTESISGLIGGTYTVVTTAPNGCSSDPQEFTIGNNEVVPTISLVKDSDLTTCNNTKNGAATVTVTPVGAETYTFSWFSGSGTTTPITPTTVNGTNSQQATNLAAGTYTALARNNSTGCESTANITIDSVAAVINIATASFASKTDVTDCSPTNGQIAFTQVDVTAGGSTTNYTSNLNTDFRFLLYNADASTLLGVFDGDTTGLAATTYIVEVQERSSGCTSASREFVIGDVSVGPTLIASQAAPSSICAGGTAPTGSATVAITAPTGTYTYQWYTGTTASAGNIIDNATNDSADEQTLANVAAGQYTVLVTDTDGTGLGCTNTATATVTENPATITINTADNVGATNCDNLNNGSYTITEVFEDGANAAAIADYTYEFFDNGGNSLGAASTTASTSGLAPGNYSVIIIRASSNCTSASLPFTISDESVQPTVAIATVDNTSCSGTTANGSLTAAVTLSGDEVAADYSFTWYYSTPANVGNTGSATQLTNNGAYTSNAVAYTVSVSDNGGYTGNVLGGLPENETGQVYWVRVTDNDNPSATCYTDASESIVDDPATIVVTAVTETDADQCSPVNGAIQIDAITINGNATNTAAGFETLQTDGYSFEILQANGTTLVKAFDVAASAATTTFPAATT
ncbi:MAG: LamG domain-containing protein, partial [Cyclobacteriaceae bacterium]